MNIIIKKHLLLYKGYKLKCSIGKSGISSSKKEGDLATPKGTFALGKVYCREDRIKLPKCKIKKKIGQPVKYKRKYTRLKLDFFLIF